MISKNVVFAIEMQVSLALRPYLDLVVALMISQVVKGGTLLCVCTGRGQSASVWLARCLLAS